MKCIKELEEIDRRRRQRRCRPTVPISEAPRQWWKYAARCHIGIDSLKSKMTWEDILQRGRENVAYVDACTKLLGGKSLSLLTTQSQIIHAKVMEQSVKLSVLSLYNSQEV